MEKRTYKAYNAKGELMLHCWARSPGAIAAEEGAFQSRLDRGELFYVDVISSEPHVHGFRMWPRSSANGSDKK